jgi:GDP-L-fucose synthase
MENSDSGVDVLVTGSSGLLGSALRRCHFLADKSVVWASSKDADLRDRNEARALLHRYKPRCIIHLAACVGGLYKNEASNLRMFEDNLRMNMNVLESAHNEGVQRGVFCLSTCIYPTEAPIPLKEESLHLGPPHESNEGYAYAKRMLEVQCRLYRREHGRDYKCVVPTNLYGPGDNFSLEDGHVLPSLIHRCFLAKEGQKPFVVRGTGKPIRQFIHADDAAAVIAKLATNDTGPTDTYNLCTPEVASIADLAQTIAGALEYETSIIFDDQYSDGQLVKTANCEKGRGLLDYPHKFIRLEDGIRNTVRWFVDNYPNVRR